MGLSEDDMLREAQEIDREPGKRMKSLAPVGYIIGLFLVLMLILMIFPHYGIKSDPRPDHIPTIEEVMIFDAKISNETKSLKTRADFYEFVVPHDKQVKSLANKISSVACSGERVCHAKAIYYFVRDNFDYISDPVNFEYVEMPFDFVLSGGGDCESGTLLMTNLLEAVGIDVELVFIPGHAFLRAKLPQASSKYKMDGDWVYLDWTCKTCDFGEISPNSVKAKKSFLEV